MHKTCFNAKKDRERAAEREESIRREIESNKKSDYWFGPKCKQYLQQQLLLQLLQFDALNCLQI